MKIIIIISILTLLYCIHIQGQYMHSHDLMLIDLHIEKGEENDSEITLNHRSNFLNKHLSKNRPNRDNYVLKEILFQRWYLMRWNDVIKWEYHYNSNWDLMEHYNYSYDPPTNDWYNYEKFEYTYEQGLTNEILIYFWTSHINSWVPTWKYNYAYNVNENLSQINRNKWVESDSTWKDSIRCRYSYNSNGLLFEEVYESADIYPHNPWRRYKNYIYYYNSFNKLSELRERRCRGYDTIYYYYDEFFSYNQNQELTESSFTFWFVSDNDTTQGKWTFTLNNGNIVEELCQNYKNSTLINFMKLQYKYDSNNNMIEKTDIRWIISNSKWENREKQILKYYNTASIHPDFKSKIIPDFKPTTNKICIQSQLFDNKNIQIAIYNLSGRKIGFKNVENANNKIFFNLNAITKSSNVLVIVVFDEKNNILFKKELIILK